MHPYPAGRDRDRPRCSARARAAIWLAAALALTGGLCALPAASPSAAHAADTPRADRKPERKAPARKKSRPAHDTAYGREGDPRKATRTIRIEMSDTMRYFPDHVTVKKGQTVRFLLTNAGELPHEMVLGTMDELKKNAALMKDQGEDTTADAPNIVHVAPGRRGSLVWQFTRAGEFYYGCLVPGHFDAGMIGTIVVRSGR